MQVSATELWTRVIAETRELGDSWVVEPTSEDAWKTKTFNVRLSISTMKPKPFKHAFQQELGDACNGLKKNER
eukprot:12663639-Alexandrium_andersonii.AAC.1